MTHPPSRITDHALKAFTLIELLVVIAIIAIIAAILFPVFAQAKAAAKQSVCLSNEKQLGIAQQLYLNDHDDVYPGPNQRIQQPPGIVGDVNQMPYDLQLMPYLKSTAVFLCPGDGGARLTPASSRNISFWDVTWRKRAIPRSYHYVSNMITAEAKGWDLNTGMGEFVGVGYPASRIEQPSDTIAYVEAWGGKSMTDDFSSYMGSPWSSIFGACDAWKLAGRKPKVYTGSDSLPGQCQGYGALDPSPGHNGGSNYVMADTSAKRRTWSQVRKNDFAMFKLQKSSQTFVP